MDLEAKYKKQQSSKGTRTVDYAAQTRGQTYRAPTQEPVENEYTYKAPFREDRRSNFRKVTDVVGGALYTIGEHQANTFKWAAEAISGFAQKKSDLEYIQAKGNNAVREIETAHKAYKAGSITKVEYDDILRGTSDIFKQNNAEAQSIDEDLVLRKYLLATAEVVSMPLAFGKLTKLSSGFKAGAALAKGPTGALVKGISIADDALSKIPSLSSIYKQKTGLGTGVEAAITGSGRVLTPRTAQELTKDMLTGALYKYPFNIKFTYAEAADIWDAGIEGKYGEAGVRLALFGTMWFNGGPFGAVSFGFKKIGKGAKIALYGERSYVSALFKQTKDGMPGFFRHLDDLKVKKPDMYDKVLGYLKQSEAWNAAKFGNGIDGAMGVKAYYMTEYGIDISKWTARELLEDMTKHVESVEHIQKRIATGLVKGVDATDNKAYTAVRFDTQTRAQLLEELVKTYSRGGGGKVARAKILEKYRVNGVAWANNQKLFNKMMDDTQKLTRKELERSIRGYKVSGFIEDAAEWTKKDLDFLAKRGYIPTKVFGNRTYLTEGLGKLKVDSLPKIGSQVVEDFEQAIQPFPIFSTVGAALNKVGLGIEDTGKTTYRLIKDNFTANLADLNLPIFTEINGSKAVNGNLIRNEGSYVLGKLQEYVTDAAKTRPFNQPPVADVRFLKTKEVINALERGGVVITKTQARQIQNALRQSYIDIPLQLRGLGDKIVDRIIDTPGLGNPYRAYLRIAGQFRYAYNPFFRAQEQVETVALSGNAIFRVSPNKTKAARKALEEAGFFRETMGTRGFGSFSTDDLTFGAITGNLSGIQKNSLSALAEKMAVKQGKTVNWMIKNKPEELADALKVVVGYKSTGPLNSPLARTLNLAIFPSRYNLKVAGMTANALAKMPNPVQLAVVNSAFEMQDWLKSDEGIKWQSEYADVISLLRWITPVGTLEWTWNTLFNQEKIDGVGDLGLLGGVPLGFITQILDSQGVIDINTPYVSPKTGDLYADKVPISSRGRLQQALTDLISSTFTYPGRTIGLPGKGKTIRGVVEEFVPTDRSDFRYEYNEDEVSEYDRRVMEVLGNGDMVEHTVTYRKSPIGYSMPTVVSSPITQRELNRRKELPTKTNSRGRKGTYLPDGSRRVISRVKFD